MLEHTGPHNRLRPDIDLTSSITGPPVPAFRQDTHLSRFVELTLLDRRDSFLHTSAV
jgi:hypothetical protein